MRQKRGAFTLIEIMITILIIGILLNLAVPNFLRARETGRARACTKNLQLIDSAKEQWAMDNRYSTGSTAPTLSSLVGTGMNGYIKATPVCPSSGNYSLNDIGVTPICTYGTSSGTGSLSHTL